MACRVLGVSRSGYYDWLGRPPSLRAQENELILKHIRDMRQEGDGRRTYGSPRVHAELRDEYGMPVNLKRVARLMRQAGIQGRYRRRRGGRTVSDPTAETFPDLVDRNFAADAPNRLWVADIERHEALWNRVEVGDLRRRVVAAAR